MFPMKLASAKGYCDDQELDACQCLKRLKDSSGCLNCGTCLVYYFWCPFIIHLSPTSVCCGQLHNVLLCTPSMLPGRPSIVPTAFPDNPSPYHNILGPILLLLDNSWWEYARTFEVHDCLQDTKVAIHDGKYPQVCMNLVNYSKGAEAFILSCDVVEVEHLLGNPCLQSFQLSMLCHLPYNTQSGFHNHSPWASPLIYPHQHQFIKAAYPCSVETSLLVPIECSYQVNSWLDERNI